MPRPITSILVANRGEIALRIIRTCKELGIRTVAIYSDADIHGPWVRLADEAHPVGPPPAGESYLRGDRIIEIAKLSGCDAIHPGYGFLSENPTFRDSTDAAGLVFIGPSADAMRSMGDKTSARKLAVNCGVPIVAGTTEPITSTDEAKGAIKTVGYPILIKAAGGGGGKGMRIVRREEELESSLMTSRSEARSAFNDDRVYIEKYIENPRHIEVQVIADHAGNALHLGERECSIQRRHQKIIEESPSILLDDNIRRQLTEAAVVLVRSSGYTNAGTVEFIVDAEKNFYFLEMNTRLQVEHPVTEMRTGMDLVREQIRISSGEKLPYRQNEITFSGHAIECRIYAEDPSNNFFPSTGTILRLRTTIGLGMREDRGIEEGDEILPYYDPLIAKLIAWGNNRDEALTRMVAALEMYEIAGVRNNVRLCRWILDHPDFRTGKISTNFLDQHLSTEFLREQSEAILTAVAITAGHMFRSSATSFCKQGAKGKSKWRSKLFQEYH